MQLERGLRRSNSFCQRLNAQLARHHGFEAMTLCLVNPGGIKLAWSVDVQGSTTAALCRTHQVVMSSWIHYCTSNMTSMALPPKMDTPPIRKHRSHIVL